MLPNKIDAQDQPEQITIAFEDHRPKKQAGTKHESNKIFTTTGEAQRHRQTSINKKLPIAG